MVRTFIVLIEIAILIIALRSSFVQYLFTDMQQGISNWLTEISQIAEKKELLSLRETYTQQVNNLSEYQLEYIEDITSNKQRLEHFFLLYCEKGDKNPFVYGENLQNLCHAIRNTQVLEGKLS